MDSADLDAALAELVGDVATAAPEYVPPIPIPEPVYEPAYPRPVAVQAMLPEPKATHHDLACLGCGEVRSYRLGVGFPCCPPCLQRLGAMTWDERVAIHGRRKTFEQVIAERGIRTYGPVGDRLHVPVMFERAKASPDVAAWARTRKGTLVLHGPTGTGKSYQAVGALRSLIEGREGQGYLVNCAGLNRMGRDEFAIYSRCAALALDDLGARMTPACLAAAYELIDARHSHMLPLILTTNITLEGIITVDERIGSRLGGGTWVAMTGADRRLA